LHMIARDLRQTAQFHVNISTLATETVPTETLVTTYCYILLFAVNLQSHVACKDSMSESMFSRGERVLGDVRYALFSSDLALLDCATFWTMSKSNKQFISAFIELSQDSINFNASSFKHKSNKQFISAFIELSQNLIIFNASSLKRIEDARQC
jgi:hypothetical protein